MPHRCKGAVRASKLCGRLADLSALHLCHAAANVLSVSAKHLHRLQIFQTACRHGHFRLSVHNSSDSGTVEFGMHAFTVGAAVVSLLRWLSELRERLLKVKQHLVPPCNAEAWPQRLVMLWWAARCMLTQQLACRLVPRRCRQGCSAGLSWLATKASQTCLLVDCDHGAAFIPRQHTAYHQQHLEAKTTCRTGGPWAVASSRLHDSQSGQAQPGGGLSGHQGGHRLPAAWLQQPSQVRCGRPADMLRRKLCTVCLADTSKLNALGVAWPPAFMLVLPCWHPGRQQRFCSCTALGQRSPSPLLAAGCSMCQPGASWRRLPLRWQTGCRAPPWRQLLHPITRGTCSEVAAHCWHFCCCASPGCCSMVPGMKATVCALVICPQPGIDRVLDAHST